MLFPLAWFAAGIVSAESAADFARYAQADPNRPLRHWKWMAFRDFVEENTPLLAEVCRAAYTLGETEAGTDANLGTAMMCSMLYQRACPKDVLDRAQIASAAVQRARARR